MLSYIEQDEVTAVRPATVGGPHRQQADGFPSSLESAPQATTIWSTAGPDKQPRGKQVQQRIPLPAFKQPLVTSDTGLLAAALNSLDASQSGQNRLTNKVPTPERGVVETSPVSILRSALTRSEFAIVSAKSDIVAAEPSFAFAEPVIEAKHDLASPNDSGQLDSAPDAPATSPNVDEQDRRAFPRRNSGCQVVVYRNGQGPSIPPTGESHVEFGHAGLQSIAGELSGLLLDVSMNGAAFLVSEPMERGEEVYVRLSNQQFGRHIDASVTVVRSTAVDNGRWKIVCQFRRNLTFEQVYEFGKQQLASPFV